MTIGLLSGVFGWSFDLRYHSYLDHTIVSYHSLCVGFASNVYPKVVGSKMFLNAIAEYVLNFV